MYPALSVQNLVSPLILAAATALLAGLWPAIRAAEKYRMRLYQRFFEESGEGFGESGEPIPQSWIIGNADECVAQLTEFIRTFGITDIATMAVPPGMRAEQMTQSLESLFTNVAPRLKQQLDSSGPP